MFRKLRDYFRFCFGMVRPIASVHAAEERARQDFSRTAEMQRKLLKRQRQIASLTRNGQSLMEQWRSRIDKIEKRMNDICEEAVDDLREAERIQCRWEETTDGLRSELRVLKDTTVPGLVASNRMVLSELDAYTAIQTRRQVAASVNTEEM